MSTPKAHKPYRVWIARDTSESLPLDVLAEDDDAAKDEAFRRYGQLKCPAYVEGDSAGKPYVASVEEITPDQVQHTGERPELDELLPLEFFVVLQEGGSSTECYANVFRIRDEADDCVKDCEENTYSAVVVPVSVPTPISSELAVAMADNMARAALKFRELQGGMDFVIAPVPRRRRRGPGL